MTRLYNDPASFTDDMLAGFLDANARYVTGVPGGVVRVSPTRPGKVAVVVGGGTGHYPAFCGLVGRGFADGAVVGNIFTSPSAAAAVSVARAADGGAGVLLTTGNYAGDVMNFGLAVEQLEAEGIPALYLAVTDDIASGPADDIAARRGIAGDFTVFKCASAAAEAGYDLDGVFQVAAQANDNTRTLGVAFDGCTLPGAPAPLFTVEQGTMGLGLGIHGEPGVATHELPSAVELAELLVDGVLKEKPAGAGSRIAVILNGLGRTKYEELFVVWATAAELLRTAGYTVVQPEVGELVTSLDMAGCSLTVMWLDGELERFWTAPADTPAYRRGSIIEVPPATRRSAVTDTYHHPDIAATADDAARQGGVAIAQALHAVASAMIEAEAELGRIDAIAGDGDHGRGMVRGTAAACAAADEAVRRGAGQGGVLRAAGDAWAARAGGTSGVLWGAALTALGDRLGDVGRPTDADIVAGLRAAYDSLARLGKARPGDKTMLDALLPLIEVAESGASWHSAAAAAESAARATAEMRPKVGRARPLAERSIGSPDAGAISLAMCARVVADLFGPLVTEGAHR